ncbi:MAG TPA: amine oxidase, partial [Ruminiclostridium sp.]|nr:amine oxidase [Ruminiclostridium sp.]
LDPSHDLYKLDDEATKTLFLDGLKKIFPDFSEDWIINIHVNRTLDAQPVVRTGYSKLIPEFETPMKGLYLASMAQIYPEDRGQNYAIRAGLKAAEGISP